MAQGPLITHLLHRLTHSKKKQGDALCADRAGAFLGKGFNALCQTLGLGKGPRSGWKVYISMLLSLSMVHIGLSVYLVWHWILGFKFLRHAQLSQLCFQFLLHVDVRDGQDPLLPAPSVYAESWTSCQKLDLAKKNRDFPHRRGQGGWEVVVCK